MLPTTGSAVFEKRRGAALHELASTAFEGQQVRQHV
jgi:hypothetical protein